MNWIFPDLTEAVVYFSVHMLALLYFEIHVNILVLFTSFIVIKISLFAMQQVVFFTDINFSVVLMSAIKKNTYPYASTSIDD